MSTLAKAIIYTWGTKWGASDYGHSKKAKKEGGNVGHASIELRVPVNKETKALIEKYCVPNRIPFELRRTKIPTLEFKKNHKGEFTGKYKISEKSAHESEYYSIYFSFWPGLINYSLNKNLEEDQVSERLGVRFDWREPYLNDKALEIDTRGKKKIGPSIIVHNLPKKFSQKKPLIDFSKTSNNLRKHENELWRIRREKSIIKSKDPDDPRLKELKDKEEKLDAEATRLRRNLQDLEKKLKETNLYEKHVTKGLPPNNQIEIPIKDVQKNQSGLDLEGALQGMVKVITNKKGYDLYSNNCSAAIGTVVQNSIPKTEKGLHEKFRTTGFIGISTPQVIFKSAVKVSSKITKDRTGKNLKKIGLREIFLSWLKEIKDYFSSKNKANKAIIFSANKITEKKMKEKKGIKPKKQ